MLLILIVSIFFTRVVRRRQEAGGRGQGAGGRRQEAGGRRQEAGGRGQEAGGRRKTGFLDKPTMLTPFFVSLKNCNNIKMQLSTLSIFPKVLVCRLLLKSQ
ncbi:MAG: hypothetical protein V7K41_17645 [Nostoc sp.]|uniref:hypothetical protein n=1 Tax=Nostoc sp. TaxID=1180 RepID=UPI002FFABBE7